MSILTAIRRRVVGYQAPMYTERDLPNIWFDASGGSKPGEVVPRFMLWNPVAGRHESIDLSLWCKLALNAGACFLSVFSQWPGGNPGWPEKGTEAYANGQQYGIADAAKALVGTGYKLDGIRIVMDSEDKHSVMVPLALSLATGLGFKVDSDHWAANYNSGPFDYAWLHKPAMDGKTAGISTYGADGSMRLIGDINAEIGTVKRAGGRFALWYNVKGLRERTALEAANLRVTISYNTTEQADLAAFLAAHRRDRACVAVIGWNA